jgi:hypothetical protein
MELSKAIIAFKDWSATVTSLCCIQWTQQGLWWCSTWLPSKCFFWSFFPQFHRHEIL